MYFFYRKSGREDGEKTLQWFTNYFKKQICFDSSEIHLREFKQAFENKSVSLYGTKNGKNVNFYNLFVVVVKFSRNVFSFSYVTSVCRKSILPPGSKLRRCYRYQRIYWKPRQIRMVRCLTNIFNNS